MLAQKLCVHVCYVQSSKHLRSFVVQDVQTAKKSCRYACIIICWYTGRLIGTNQLKGSTERITTCTTAYFDGFITVIDPESSWVARWQRTCV